MRKIDIFPILVKDLSREDNQEILNSLVYAALHSLAILSQPVTQRLRGENTVFDGDIKALERVTMEAIEKATTQKTL